jgi:hypothetical protein
MVWITSHHHHKANAHPSQDCTALGVRREVDTRESCSDHVFDRVKGGGRTGNRF